MSLPAAIAARRGQAINRLSATMAAISDKYDIPAVAIGMNQKTGTDPYIAQMREIESFDTWTMALADKLGVTLPEPEPEPVAPLPFEGMSLEGIQAIASDRGVIVRATAPDGAILFSPKLSEAELLKALRAQVGVSTVQPIPEAPETPAEPEPVAGLEQTSVEYEAMTIADLRTMADIDNIDLGDATKKADIIDIIRTAQDQDREIQI